VDRGESRRAYRARMGRYPVSLPAQGFSTAPTSGHEVPTSTTQAKRLALLHGPDRWWKPPVSHAFSYPGRFDVARLELTLRLLARRHSVLRTYLLPGRSIDVVGCLPAKWAVWPLRVTDADTPDEVAAAFTWLQRDFDPFERPLTRALLLREPDHDVLGIAVEHSLFDGFSARLLLADLATVYDGLKDRPAAEFDVPVSDAARFARDERDWLDGAAGKAALAYWDRHNAGLGAYPRLELPIAAPYDPAAPIHDCVVPLSEDEVIAFRQRMIDARLSGPMLASAAIAVSLREHTSSDDVPFLFSYSRRAWRSTRDLVGYVANRVQLRVRVDRTDSVAAMTPRVRAGVVEAVEHGMLSHEQYVRTRFPEHYDRKPTIPYLLLNFAAQQGNAPSIGGTPCTKVSLPSRNDIYCPPGLGVNLGLRADGTGTLLSFHPRGMYDLELVETLTRAIARRCVTGA